jgi:hypothetical protein
LLNMLLVNVSVVVAAAVTTVVAVHLLADRLLVLSIVCVCRGPSITSTCCLT